VLSQVEQAEYEHIVRLNDLLSMLKLQAEEYWAPRTMPGAEGVTPDTCSLRRN
jgi:hypothetical protein